MPSVQAPHRGHRPLPRGCRILMRTRRCPGHRTDGSRPWLQRRPTPTGSHKDGTTELTMPDPDQPHRRPVGIARPPLAAGQPCGKTPRGPTAVARGHRRRRRPRSHAGGPAMTRRRLARRGCRTRGLRLRGHRIWQTHLKPAAITGHSRDLPDPCEPRPYARKGLCHRRPRRDADFRTLAQAAARCGRGWGGAATVLAWVPPVSPLGGGRREGLGRLHQNCCA